MCVVSCHGYLCCKWSCILVLQLVVDICVVSGRVYMCGKWSCIFVL
jgi:hypothetical protein